MKRLSVIVLAGLFMMMVSASSIVGREKDNTPFGAKDYTVQMAFAKDYMDFLGACKTVRESVTYFETRAIQDGFVNWEPFMNRVKRPKPGIASTSIIGAVRCHLADRRFRQSQSATEQFAVPPGETGMDTIYFGFPLVSMHTLFELTHKVDLYSAYLAYRFFLQDELKKK